MSLPQSKLQKRSAGISYFSPKRVRKVPETDLFLRIFSVFSESMSCQKLVELSHQFCVNLACVSILLFLKMQKQASVAFLFRSEIGLKTPRFAPFFGYNGTILPDLDDSCTLNSAFCTSLNLISSKQSNLRFKILAILGITSRLL